MDGKFWQKWYQVGDACLQPHADVILLCEPSLPDLYLQFLCVVYVCNVAKCAAGCFGAHIFYFISEDIWNKTALLITDVMHHLATALMTPHTHAGVRWQMRLTLDSSRFRSSASCQQRVKYTGCSGAIDFVFYRIWLQIKADSRCTRLVWHSNRGATSTGYAECALDAVGRAQSCSRLCSTKEFSILCIFSSRHSVDVRFCLFAVMLCLPIFS